MRLMCVVDNPRNGARVVHYFVLRGLAMPETGNDSGQTAEKETAEDAGEEPETAPVPAPSAAITLSRARQNAERNQYNLNLWPFP